ncbi:MAG: hypothetical protein K0S27_820 [Gammaproteobacteria bacterium]|jgi:hypothetical protein|nr:hypothetical protein [Gammaproteobacteria bacterium]
MVKIICYFILGVLFFTVIGCSLFQNNPQTNQRARCKELNYRMINNGKTGNRLLATQQAAQSEVLTRSYREERCS